MSLRWGDWIGWLRVSMAWVYKVEKGHVSLNINKTRGSGQNGSWKDATLHAVKLAVVAQNFLEILGTGSTGHRAPPICQFPRNLSLTLALTVASLKPHDACSVAQSSQLDGETRPRFPWANQSAKGQPVHFGLDSSCQGSSLPL